MLCDLIFDKSTPGTIRITGGTVKETTSCGIGGPGVSPGGAGGAGGVGVATPPPPGSGSSRTKTNTTLLSDPRTTEYFKAIKRGAPIVAVKLRLERDNPNKVEKDRIDPSWLDQPADRELYADDDLSKSIAVTATVSTTASTSAGSPIPNDKIETITTLFNTPEQIKKFQDYIPSSTKTYIGTDYTNLKTRLNELKSEMNKTPRPSNYKEVQKMIDDNIKKIIQPSLDILNNFPNGTTLSSSDISNANDNIKKIEDLKGFLSSFISQTFNNELKTQISRVKMLFPSAKPLGDITTKEEFNKALKNNDPRFYKTLPSGMIEDVYMDKIKETYQNIYGEELDKSKLDKLLDNANIKAVQKKLFKFSGGRRNMRRNTRKHHSNNRNTRRSKH